MNPFESIASALRNFLNFNGRASRSEFLVTRPPFPIAAVVNLALQCGIQLQPEARYCSVCGTSV